MDHRDMLATFDEALDCARALRWDLRMAERYKAMGELGHLLEELERIASRNSSFARTFSARFAEIRVAMGEPKRRLHLR